MKWLIALILILLLVWRFWPEPEPIPVEETFIGPQVKVLQNAQTIEQEYLEAQEARKKRIEEELEKQDGGG